ncbi:MAG: VanZ family protein [Bdellovibrionota bacterium]
MTKEWSWALTLILTIYLVAPIGRALQVYARDTFGSAGMLCLLFGGAVIVVALAVRRLNRLRVPKRRYAILFAASVVGLSISWSLRDNPEEIAHVWEYGLLTFFFWAAIDESGSRSAATALTAALLSTCVGVGDELIQWALPNRYFDFRDIRINSGASLLTGTALAMGEGLTLRPITGRTARLLELSLALFLFLVALLTTLTPGHILRLTKAFPPLGFLQDEPVIDFGVLNALQSGVQFPSHFAVDELRSIDDIRGAEVSSLLASQQAADRERFLAEYSDARDPFVNEAEVHLFRRNHYLEQWRLQDSPGSATIVLGEQQILDGCFPKSSRHSPLAQELRERLSASVGDSFRYRSPVAESLVVSVSAFQIETAIFGIAVVWLVWLLSSRKRTTS